MKPNPKLQFISIIERSLIKYHKMTNKQARRIAGYMWDYRGVTHDLCLILEKMEEQHDAKEDIQD
jgi:hypothetical protein